MGVLDYLRGKGVNVKTEEPEEDDRDYTAVNLPDDIRDELDLIMAELKEKSERSEAEKKTNTVTTTTNSKDDEYNEKSHFPTKEYDVDFVDCPKCKKEKTITLHINKETGLINDDEFGYNKECYSCNYSLSDVEVDGFNDILQEIKDDEVGDFFDNKNQETLFNDDEEEEVEEGGSKSDVDDEDFDNVGMITCPYCDTKYSVLVYKNQDDTIIPGAYNCDNCGEYVDPDYMDDFNLSVRKNKEAAKTNKTQRNHNNANTIQTYDYKCPKCNEYAITGTIETINGVTKGVEYERCKNCNYTYDNDNNDNNVDDAEEKVEENDILKPYTFVKIQETNSAMRNNYKQYNNSVGIVMSVSADKKEYRLWILKDGKINSAVSWFPRENLVKTPLQDKKRAQDFVDAYGKSNADSIRRKVGRDTTFI